LVSFNFLRPLQQFKGAKIVIAGKFSAALNATIGDIIGDHDFLLNLAYTYLLDESPKIYYSLTLPERKRDSALSKLTASMDKKTFGVTMSKNYGKPLDVTGSFALKDFDNLSTPVQSSTARRSSKLHYTAVS
jgi:hypothetical protein